jgi:hypothetical protein
VMCRMRCSKVSSQIMSLSSVGRDENLKVLQEGNENLEVFRAAERVIGAMMTNDYKLDAPMHQDKDDVQVELPGRAWAGLCDFCQQRRRTLVKHVSCRLRPDHLATFGGFKMEDHDWK